MPLSDALPTSAINYIVELLTGVTKLDRNKAVREAYDVVGWILGKFFSTASAASAGVKPKKVSKKQLAATLQALTDTKSAHAEGLPTWLIPVLLDLIKNWLAKK